MMNGTSMASPNAAGCIALIVSALKDARLPYTPASLRRAVENSAAPVAGADVFGLGRGLVSVAAAHALVTRLAAAPVIHPRYSVSVGCRGQARWRVRFRVAG